MYLYYRMNVVFYSERSYCGLKSECEYCLYMHTHQSIIGWTVTDGAVNITDTDSR